MVGAFAGRKQAGAFLAWRGGGILQTVWTVMIMNFTSTPPTKPGAYWWTRLGYPKELREVKNSAGCLLCFDGAYPIKPREMGGAWCGPLVPADEVKAAFIEGVIQTDGNFNAEACYEDSRARRIALGEET
jgi:hypothetical protein